MSEYLYGNDIKRQVKEYLIDRLSEFEGCDVVTYVSNIKYILMEEDYYKGCIKGNSNVIEWIGENFSDLGEIVEEIEFQLGSENIPNVFTEPERFQLVVYSEVASYLFGQCKFINDDYDEEIILSDEAIEILQKQLEEL